MKEFRSFEEKFAGHIIIPNLINKDSEGFEKAEEWIVYQNGVKISNHRTLTEARVFCLNKNRVLKVKNEKNSL